MKDVQGQLEVASRYGGGVDVNDKPIRPTKRSRRPSSYIPSAWDAFSDKQKGEIEANLEATRSRLRTELTALEARAAALKGNIALRFCKNSDSIVIKDLNAFIGSIANKFTGPSSPRCSTGPSGSMRCWSSSSLRGSCSLNSTAGHLSCSATGANQTGALSSKSAKLCQGSGGIGIYDAIAIDDYDDDRSIHLSPPSPDDFDHVDNMRLGAANAALADAVKQLSSIIACNGHQVPDKNACVNLNSSNGHGNGLVALEGEGEDDEFGGDSKSSISRKFMLANENIRKLSSPKPHTKYVTKPSLPDESEMFFKDCYEEEFKIRSDFELSSGKCPFSPSESQELIGALAGSEAPGHSERFARTRPRAHEPLLTSDSGSCPSVSKSGPKPAFVEYCCGHSSLLSKEAGRKGFHALRFTKDSHDLISTDGFERALKDIASLISEGRHIKLWASLPCRPWSIRSHMNLARLGSRYRRLLTFQRLESFFLIQGFIQVAEVVLQAKGSVSFEWPAFCQGWDIPILQEFFQKHGFSFVRIDGCAMKLHHKNKPIKKPWKIATNEGQLIKGLKKYRCKCPKDLIHEPCAGKLASASETYTPFMAEKVIGCLLVSPNCCDVEPELASQGAVCAFVSRPADLDIISPAIKVNSGTLSPNTVNGDRWPAVSPNLDVPLDLSFAGDSCECTESDAKALSAAVQAEEPPGPHRPKHSGASSNVLGLVTKTIPPSSPEFHSAAGRAAINKEVGGLRDQTVWDETTVAEWSTVRHQRHNGYPSMVGLLFIIMGLKNAELVGTPQEIEAILKARAVFQGSNIRTGDGTPAHLLYQEVGACPSNMTTAHCAIAAGALKGSRATTRDAHQAYIQSSIDLPGRPRTWIRLPKYLWPPSWFNSDGSPKYYDPVCVLRKSLYGHPESGAIWDKKLHKIMRSLGFETLEGTPGFFYHKKDQVEVTVYVDDFILIAPPHLEKRIWAALSEQITFKDPPEILSRYLGIYHHFKTLPDGTIQMITEAKDYVLDAVKTYMEECKVSSLSWVPSPSIDDKFDVSHSQPGALAKNAASHLMKLLYVARMVRGDFLTTVTFLARRIHYWSVNEDKRLCRLMAYAHHHCSEALVHELHPKDLERAFLDYSPDAELGGDPYSTKASGGYWLELSSPCGTRKWPLGWAVKKAGHTSGSTADSETWSLVGANDTGLKREVIPVLAQLEVTLQRAVKLICKEDNTACIAAIKRGYSVALRYLKRHTGCSLGFTNEVFFPDLNEGSPQYWAQINYWESKLHKGDWMTKELPPASFEKAKRLAGYIPTYR